MLRRIHSWLTWSSALLLLLISFFALHSIGRCDIWSWSTADVDETVSSSATLGVGRGRLALNVWIHNDDGSAIGTTLNHLPAADQLPRLRDGIATSSVAGFTVARGAKAAPTTVSYLGIMMPLWAPLVLFAILPLHSLIGAVRRRPPLRIVSRLMTALSLLSFAAAIFLVVMWIRSFAFDYVAVPDKFFSENYAYFHSSGGITYWYFFDEPLRLPRPMWWRFPSGQSGSRLAATMDPASRFLGFGKLKTTYLHASLFSGFSPPRPLTIVAIPYYALLALSLILPVGTLTRQIGINLRKRRRSNGQCPECGYDMRATPDQCPECGHKPQRAPPPAPATPT